MSENDKKLAHLYALGLGCGLWNREGIISWCDRLIEANDSPPYEIIEISLMTTAKPVFIESALLSYSRTVDEKTSVNILISVINEKLVEKKWNIKQAITCSTRLLVNRGLHWEEEYFDLYNLDDSYDLAQEGIHFNEENVIFAYINILSAFRVHFNDFEDLYLKVMKQEWEG
ncbi:protein kinase [Bacillus cereus]|uniref:Protein kinase n=1 Tax=Bacillus cereus TaxID=1396 RepID=A0A2A8Y4X0_BACCE|nr:MULTISPECIES: protein kinase [Bacillus cereus group]PDY87076.1 protein kinase [Bacillus toyonensis]PFC74440.1 protein kinase [Bacillus cereus]PFV07739.1 protein kinase [Bacillus cereus]PGV46735.1 protein kinase [Bacillus cereus]